MNYAVHFGVSIYTKIVYTGIYIMLNIYNAVVNCESLTDQFCSLYLLL